MITFRICLGRGAGSASPYVSLCLPACLLAYLSVCMYACMSVRLSICLSVYLLLPRLRSRRAWMKQWFGSKTKPSSTWKYADVEVALVFLALAHQSRFHARFRDVRHRTVPVSLPDVFPLLFNRFPDYTPIFLFS